LDLESIANLVILVSALIFIAAAAIRIGAKRSRSAPKDADEPEYTSETDSPENLENAAYDPLDMIGEAETDQTEPMDTVSLGEDTDDADPIQATGETVLGESSQHLSPLNTWDARDEGNAAVTTIPYCYRCTRRIKPYREICPKCGSTVRFRFLGKNRLGEDKKGDKGGYIRPPWTGVTS
jgi:hypothetical protein